MTLEAVVPAAALVFSGAVGVVVAFQLALALGAPWGEYAMGGGRPGRFSPPMRVAAIVQAIVLGALAGLVLSRAGIVAPELTAGAGWLAWLPVVASAASLVLNLVTPSVRERRRWAPIAAVMLVSSAIVALAA